MQRRALLKGLAIGLPTVVGTAAAVTMKSAHRAKQTADQTLEGLSAQIRDLRTQFEQSERSNKKLIKAAVAIAALSLGIDISALI